MDGWMDRRVWDRFVLWDAWVAALERTYQRGRAISYSACPADIADLQPFGVLHWKGGLDDNRSITAPVGGSRMVRLDPEELGDYYLTLTA